MRVIYILLIRLRIFAIYMFCQKIRYENSMNHWFKTDQCISKQRYRLSHL